MSGAGVCSYPASEVPDRAPSLRFGGSSGMTMVVVGLAVLGATPAVAADVAMGQFLAGQCVQCHRADGRDRPGIPSIIGWPEDAFVAVLQSYKKKERPNVVMQSVAESLSDEDMAALAAYYASLKPAR